MYVHQIEIEEDRKALPTMDLEANRVCGYTKAVKSCFAPDLGTVPSQVSSQPLDRHSGRS